MVTLLTKPVIKWSSSPGKVIENHLFIDKFKMIVTIRLGNCFEGSFGKSTLINQLFNAKNIFSCCGEPCGEYGKPLTLDGSVEFIWLTQETASPKLWESVLQNHYHSERNELLLLANLHGDALCFKDQMNFLKKIASGFIVFIMPDSICDLEKNWNSLEEILDLKEETDLLYSIAVDPPNDCKFFSEENIVYSSKIASDTNIEKIRDALKSVMTNEGKIIDIYDLKSNNCLQLVDIIVTKESENLIKFVKERGCESTKKLIPSKKN